MPKLQANWYYKDDGTQYYNICPATNNLEDQQAAEALYKSILSDAQRQQIAVSTYIENDKSLYQLHFDKPGKTNLEN
ncbi:MAG TPA: hypothetical protein VLG38_06160, partial [Gammaproteobacteria bacterium]|nr:hypothetical protein [Gammaproteobacteria bacterium]